MISAEAPILFARACESETSHACSRLAPLSFNCCSLTVFIADLTCRSYLHASANRRRTIQRSDVVAAVGLSNIFDFLVDIVPRPNATQAAVNHSSHQNNLDNHMMEQQQRTTHTVDE